MLPCYPKWQRKDIVRFMSNMNQVNPPQRNGDIASKNIWLIDFTIYTSSQGIVMKKKARAWECFRGIDRWRAVSKTLNDILYWMHWQFSLTSPQRNVKKKLMFDSLCYFCITVIYKVLYDTEDSAHCAYAKYACCVRMQRTQRRVWVQTSSPFQQIYLFVRKPAFPVKYQHRLPQSTSCVV